jgi:hypothetical protein
MNKADRDLFDRIQTTTDEVESSKERKQAERVQRQKEKEKKQRLIIWEKLVAPILFATTVLISWLLWRFST